MENAIKISFSAITHIGAACTVNDDRIYANGRFMHVSESEYSGVSLETGGKQFLFALSDGMDTGASGISMMEDLKKLHGKMKNSSRDIQVKLDELSECVDQSSNLLFSMSLGEGDERLKKPAFAGILIDDGSIAAVNLGSSRIYKLDGDNFKLMVNDYKRTERLLKMGIINDEQADMLSDKYKTAGSDGKVAVKKSDIYALREGTVYLLCSRGLTDSVNEETIYDILSSGAETDVMADMLLKEALQNDAGDNVTAVVFRVESVEGEALTGTGARSIPSRNISGKINRLSRNVKKRQVDVSKLASMLVLFIVAAAFIFGAVTLYLNYRAQQDEQQVINGASSTNTGVLPEGEDEDTAAPASTDEEDVSAAEDTLDPEAGADTDTPDSEEAAVPGEGTTYKVKPGDNLMAISEKYYGDRSKYKLIMAANGITNPDKITVDQILKIPAEQPAGD